MKKSMYYFVLPLVALLLGLNAYQAVNAYEMREQRTGLERAMEKAGTPAVLSISSFGDFIAFDREGNELEQCSFQKKDNPCRMMCVLHSERDLKSYLKIR